MWVPFLVSLTAFAALAWRLLRSIRGAGRMLAAPALGFMVGLSGVVALHPRTAADPIEWLTKSISESSGYGRTGLATLTAGHSLSEFPPPWYLPAWTFAAVPVLMLLIAVVGAAVATHKAVRSRRYLAATPESSIALTGGVLLVALQLLLLPIAAIVNGSAMYSGLRQTCTSCHRSRSSPESAPRACCAGAGEPLALPAGWGGFRAHPLCCPGGAGVRADAPLPVQLRLRRPDRRPRRGRGPLGDRYQWISAREAIRRIPAGAEPACSLWLAVPGAAEFGLGPGEGAVIEPCGRILHRSSAWSATKRRRARGAASSGSSAGCEAVDIRRLTAKSTTT